MNILSALPRPSKTFRPIVATEQHLTGNRWGFLASLTRAFRRNRPPHLLALATLSRHLLEVERAAALLCPLASEIAGDGQTPEEVEIVAHYRALTVDLHLTRRRMISLILGATGDQPLTFGFESSTFAPVRSLRVGGFLLLLVVENGVPICDGASVKDLIQDLNLVVVNA